jgi:hypothetical protein
MSSMDFLDEQAAAGGSGLRALKRPGDPQWCWQTISRLQSLWESLNLDFESYMTAWAEAEENRIWEKVPYDNPFGTKEEMLRQLAIGDEESAKRRVACQAIAARASRYIGRSHTDGNDYRGNRFESGRKRNRSDALIDRIARDHPDVFERMQKGEFSSVAAAAREAGIEFAKRNRTVTLSDNVDRVADTLKGHYTGEQLRRIRERLTEEAA